VIAGLGEPLSRRLLEAAGLLREVLLADVDEKRINVAARVGASRLRPPPNCSPEQSGGGSLALLLCLCDKTTVDRGSS
jgi:hypothetical protein